MTPSDVSQEAVILVTGFIFLFHMVNSACLAGDKKSSPDFSSGARANKMEICGEKNEEKY